MHCPFCIAQDTKVIDSRLISEGHQVKRRRECQDCKSRFTTFENAELVLPKIVKTDGKREAFNEKKLRTGIEKSLEKRPIAQEQIDDTMKKIIYKLQTIGEREIPSSLLGSIVIDELKKLDKIAYIRFVSVYKSFKDLKEFGEEIAKLQDE